MNEPAEKLRRVCEHRDYYAAMQTTVDFTVDGTERDSKNFEIPDESVHYRVEEPAGWVIERGVSKLLVPYEGHKLDHPKLETPNASDEVTAVSITTEVDHA